MNGRVDAGQEPGGQFNATFADRRTRVSMIADRGIQ
jgi:hypothetical protein